MEECQSLPTCPLRQQPLLFTVAWGRRNGYSSLPRFPTFTILPFGSVDSRAYGSCFSSCTGWDPHTERHSISFSCTGVLLWFSSCREWVKMWLSLRVFGCKSYFYTQGWCVSFLTNLWPCICFPLCFVVWCKFPHAQTVWGHFPML